MCKNRVEIKNKGEDDYGNSVQGNQTIFGKKAYDRAVAWWDEEREHMHYSKSQRVAMFEYIAEDDRFREVERKELD